MQVTSFIAVCAVAAVVLAAVMHFWMSALTARTDETERVQYSVLRGFLQKAADGGSLPPARREGAPQTVSSPGVPPHTI